MAMWTIALPGNADYASYSRNPDVMDFVGWVADYVDSNTVRGRTGWESHLRAYSEPDGSSWLMGCLKRLRARS